MSSFYSIFVRLKRCMQVFTMSVCVFLLSMSVNGIFGQVVTTNTPSTSIRYSTAGTYSFTVPSGVTSFTIKAWGAGGGGQSVNDNIDRAGAGGGGGAFTYHTINNAVPGSVYTVVVGQGGAGSVNGTSSEVSLSSTVFVKAAGGYSRSVATATTTVNTGASGGSALNCIPSANALSGGNGGSGGSGGANKRGAGSGGSSASTFSAGVNGLDFNKDQATVGAVANTGGGNGGNGGAARSSGSSATSPGGGGGGEGAQNSGTTGKTAGSGADGQIIISYSVDALNVFRSVKTGNWNQRNSWAQLLSNGSWIEPAIKSPSSIQGNIAGTSSVFPEVIDITSSNEAVSVNVHDVTLPSAIVPGDLLLIYWSDRNEGTNAKDTTVTPTGWTRLYIQYFKSDLAIKADNTSIVWYRIADGTEGSSVTVTNTTTSVSAHKVYRIAAGTYEGVPEASWVEGSRSANAQSPGLDLTYGQSNALWIASSFSNYDVNASQTPPEKFTFGGIVHGGTEVTLRTAYLDSSAVIMIPKQFGSFSDANGENYASSLVAIKGIRTDYTQQSLVTVRDGHVITVNQSETADHVQVESLGKLSFSNTNPLSLNISSGSTMTVSGTIEMPYRSFISGGGVFLLNDGATFKVGSHYGLNTGVQTTDLAGNVRVTGQRTFGQLANYHFDHNGDQAVGNAVSKANNVYIENGGVKTLSIDLTVSGILTLTNGYVASTSSATVIIANNGSAVGGSDQSYVLGPIRKIGTNGTSNYSFIYPVGIKNANGSVNRSYNPVKIKYPGVTSNDITFTVTHFHQSPLTLTDKKDQVVSKMKQILTEQYWDVHNDNPGSSAASSNVLTTYGVDVTLYFEKQPSYNYTSYYLIHEKKLSDGTSVWEAPNITTQQHNKSDNSIEPDMLSVTVFAQKNFSGMGGAGTDETTPVNLTSFNARVTPENKVALSWATASESGSKGFRIERQHDLGGNKFMEIGFINTKAPEGNSAQLIYYNFTDDSPICGTTSYYRLVQEDIDGKLTNSEVRMLKMNGQSVSMVYPNPSKGDFLISRTADGKKMNIQVVNQAGRVVHQATGIQSASHKIHISNPGIYCIKLSYPETGELSMQRVVVY